MDWADQGTCKSADVSKFSEILYFLCKRATRRVKESQAGKIISRWMAKQEDIQRRRDGCQVLCWLHQTATKLSYFACTQRHSKTKRALLFQLLNSHTKPVKGNSFSLPLRRKQNRTRGDCTRRNAFVSPAYTANTLQELYPRPVTMATGAARRSESCQTVKVTAALVGSLAETSQPVGRQGLISHSVPQAFVLTHRELHNNKLSGTIDQQGASPPPSTRTLYIRAPALFSTNSPDLASNRLNPRGFYFVVLYSDNPGRSLCHRTCLLPPPLLTLIPRGASSPLAATLKRIGAG